MMGGRGGGTIGRVAMIVAWLLATAGIAFLVSRNEGSSGADGLGALSAPPISTSQRQTVTLQPEVIQPVVSGDGRVVADGADWNIEAPVKPEDQAYRLLQDPVSVKALIVGGPAGFDCGWLGLGQAPDGSMTMRCRIPDDVTVVAGLPATMVLALSEPVETMALPVTAVVGSAEQGEVVVVAADGTTSVRQVGLGVSDTFSIEITSGLDADELVLAAPVQTDFTRPRA